MQVQLLCLQLRVQSLKTCDFKTIGPFLIETYGTLFDNEISYLPSDFFLPKRGPIYCERASRKSVRCILFVCSHPVREL